MGRSEAYANQYRVGSLHEHDVYWWPGVCYSREVDHERLVKLDDLSEVEFFDRVEDWEALDEAVDVNGGLLQALGKDLMRAYMAMEEDLEFADECEAESRATLREGSGV